MNFQLRAEFLGKTEAEIREEMASALGRIGKRLETLISELHHHQKHLASCPEKEKERQIKKYQNTHREARLYYWYLMIQRESIGLRNHDLLSELYPIPPIL